MSLKRLLFGALALAVPSVILVTQASASGAPARGALLSATRIAQLPPVAIRKTLTANGISPSMVRDGVTAYRLAYETVSPTGAPITASGLLVLPDGGRPDGGTIVFEHGTTVFRGYAPSASSDTDGRLVALLDGSAGFTTVAPDYLGLGSGDGPQAYVQVKTEVSASIDLVRAARTFEQRSGRTLDGRLLVSGFSQGGQAAMGLGKALQGGNPAGLSLRGLAAVSGVYDLQPAEMRAILSGAALATTANFNLAVLALSWRQLYGVFGDPNQIFQPAGARLVHLFDGRHPDGQILAALPHTLTAMFRPGFLAQLAHPHGALLRALNANDATCDWRPQVSVKLFYSPIDEAVAPSNTASCVAALRSRGSSVDVADLGRLHHLQTILAAAPRILTWFE
jgi:hypothetical protein